MDDSNLSIMRRPGRSIERDELRYRSSRMPLKNGCRTLPSADLARYSISAESDGSTPDATVRDLFRIRLSLADQRVQSCLHLLGGRRVKTLVDLAGIDQFLAPAPADVDAVEAVLL